LLKICDVMPAACGLEVPTHKARHRSDTRQIGIGPKSLEAAGILVALTGIEPVFED
jgi:hypothetical protein